MKPGDLVTTFDGLEIPHPLAIVGALQRVDPKKPSTVVVVRAGKERKLAIAGLKPPPPEDAII
jgi:S1-C subfamily serine protease